MAGNRLFFTKHVKTAEYSHNLSDIFTFSANGYYLRVRSQMQGGGVIILWLGGGWYDVKVGRGAH